MRHITISDVYAPDIAINCTVVNGKTLEYDAKNIECGDVMPTDKEWQDRVKGLLKGELKRRHISYRDLAEKLEPLGVKESERNIANKIARGGFTAVFLVQCLQAIGAQAMRLDDM